MTVRITAQERYLKTGKQSVFEPSSLTVKAWHAGHADEESGVLLSRGRRQYRLNIEEAYELIDAIADIVEQLEGAEKAIAEAFEQRPYYTSTSEGVA